MLSDLFRPSALLIEEGDADWGLSLENIFTEQAYCPGHVPPTLCGVLFVKEALLPTVNGGTYLLFVRRTQKSMVSETSQKLALRGQAQGSLTLVRVSPKFAVPGYIPSGGPASNRCIVRSESFLAWIGWGRSRF